MITAPMARGVLQMNWLQSYPGRVDVLHRPGKLGLRSAYLNGFQKVLEMSGDVKPSFRWMRIFHMILPRLWKWRIY